MVAEVEENEEENDEEKGEEHKGGEEGDRKEEVTHLDSRYLRREALQGRSRPGNSHAGGVSRRNERCAPRSEEQTDKKVCRKRGNEISFSPKREDAIPNRRPQRGLHMNPSCLWCQRHRVKGRNSDDANSSRSRGRTPLTTSPELTSSLLAPTTAAASIEPSRASHRPHAAHSAYNACRAHSVHSAYDNEHNGQDEIDEHDDHDEGQELSAALREKPEAFFCSWECARRWNSRFSPVQARHERGLRIDVAAGRLVA